MVRETERVVRTWFAAVNARDPDAIANAITEDFTWMLWDASTSGRELSREAWRLIFEAFPDYQMDIVDLIVDGPKAAIRCTITGTHQGPLRFRGTKSMDSPIPPTGRAFRVDHALSLMEVRDGRIAVNRAYWQPAAMLQQLGVEP